MAENVFITGQLSGSAMVSYHQQLISTVPMLRSQAADRKPTQFHAKHGDEKKKSTSSITTKNNLVIYFVSRMQHFHC